MTLQQLRYFKEVASTLHFTKAAGNLFVSQSSLSHAIQSLEEELGVPLFVRQKYKSVALTNYGEAFLPFVERALGEIEDGKYTVEQMANPNIGRINLMYSFINGHSLVQSALRDFYAEEGSSGVAVNLMVNHGIVALDEEISTGSADLAVSCFLPDNEQVEYRKIARQRLYVIVSPQHPLADRQSLQIQDLAQETVFRFASSLSLYQWVTQMFQKANVTPVFADGFYDWSAIMMQVVNNRGVSILPRPPFGPGNVCVIQLDDPMQYRPMYLLWAANRALPNAVTYFRQYLIDYASAYEDV